ncbi:class IV adenylate cyclase [soil metagenome]
MLEIELKFRDADAAAVQSQLNAWQATAAVMRHEHDHYFNAADRDFAVTNEAFRIRVVNEKGILTYKGPRQPGPAKTRKEIEVPLSAGTEAIAGAVSLMTSLGFRPVATVKKQRQMRTFERDGFDLTVCFDDVEQVGLFIEVEIVAQEDRKAAAEAVLMDVCKSLGLVDVEPRSYLRMFLEGNV